MRQAQAQLLPSLRSSREIGFPDIDYVKQAIPVQPSSDFRRNFEELYCRENPPKRSSLTEYEDDSSHPRPTVDILQDPAVMSSQVKARADEEHETDGTDLMTFSRSSPVPTPTLEDTIPLTDGSSISERPESSLATLGTNVSLSEESTLEPMRSITSAPELSTTQSLDAVDTATFSNEPQGVPERNRKPRVPGSVSQVARSSRPSSVTTASRPITSSTATASSGRRSPKPPTVPDSSDRSFSRPTSASGGGRPLSKPPTAPISSDRSLSRPTSASGGGRPLSKPPTASISRERSPSGPTSASGGGRPLSKPPTASISRERSPSGPTSASGRARPTYVSTTATRSAPPPATVRVSRRLNSSTDITTATMSVLSANTSVETSRRSIGIERETDGSRNRNPSPNPRIAISPPPEELLLESNDRTESPAPPIEPKATTIEHGNPEARPAGEPVDYPKWNVFKLKELLEGSDIVPTQGFSGWNSADMDAVSTMMEQYNRDPNSDIQIPKLKDSHAEKIEIDQKLADLNVPPEKFEALSALVVQTIQGQMAAEIATLFKTLKDHIDHIKDYKEKTASEVALLKSQLRAVGILDDQDKEIAQLLEALPKDDKVYLSLDSSIYDKALSIIHDKLTNAEPLPESLVDSVHLKEKIYTNAINIAKAHQITIQKLQKEREETLDEMKMMKESILAEHHRILQIDEDLASERNLKNSLQLQLDELRKSQSMSTNNAKLEADRQAPEIERLEKELNNIKREFKELQNGNQALLSQSKRRTQDLKLKTQELVDSEEKARKSEGALRSSYESRLAEAESRISTTEAALEAKATESARLKTVHELEIQTVKTTGIQERSKLESSFQLAISSLKEELRRTQEDLESAQTSKITLEAELTTSKSILDELKSSRHIEGNEAAQAESRHKSELKLLAEAASRERAELENRLKAKITNLTLELDLTQKSLESEKASNSSHEAELREAQSLLELREKEATKAAEIALLKHQSELQNLMESNDRQRSELQEARSLLELREKETKAAEITLLKHQSELQTLVESNDRQRSELREAQSLLELREKEATKAAEIASLKHQSELQNLVESNDRQRLELQEVRSLLEIREKEATKAAEIASLKHQSELQTLVESNERQRSELQEVQSLLELREKETKAAEIALLKYQSELQNLESGDRQRSELEGRLRDRIGQLESELSSLLSAHEIEIMKKQRELEDLTDMKLRELAELENRSQVTIRHLESELESQRGHASGLLTSKESDAAIIAKLSQAKKDLEEVDRNRNDWIKEFQEDMNIEKQKLNSEIQSLQDELGRERAKRSVVVDQVPIVGGTLGSNINPDQSSPDMNQVAEDAISKKQISQLRKELKVRIQSERALEDQLKVSIQSEKALEGQIKDLRQKLKEKDNIEDSLDKRLKEVEAAHRIEKKKLKSQLEARKIELEGLAMKIANLESQNKALEESILQRRATETSAAHIKIDRLVSEVEDLRESIKKIQNELDVSIFEKNEQFILAQRREGQINLLNQEIQEMSLAAKKAAQEQRETYAHIDTLNSAFASQEESAQRLQQEVAILSAKIDYKDKSIKALQTIIESSTDETNGMDILRQQVEEKTKEIEKLQERFHGQEEQVRKAQVAAFSNLETVKHIFLEDNEIEQRLRHEVFASIEKWVREYVPRRQTPTNSQVDQSLITELSLISKPDALETIGQKHPQIIVQALLSHFAVENLLRQPFRLLSPHQETANQKNNAAEVLQSLYDAFLQCKFKFRYEISSELLTKAQMQAVDVTQGHEWRFKTFQLLSQLRSQVSSSLSNILQQGQTDYSSLLARNFINGPASTMFGPCSSPSDRLEKLISVFDKIADVAIKLWSQKAFLSVRGFSDLKDSPFSWDSSHFQAHALHHLSRGGKTHSRDGDPIYMVIQPEIIAYGNEEGLDYDKEKVWARAVVALSV